MIGRENKIVGNPIVLLLTRGNRKLFLVRSQVGEGLFPILQSASDVVVRVTVLMIVLLK
jgi:hypothetical protein